MTKIVNIQLDLSIPVDKLMFDAWLGPTPPPEYTQAVAKPADVHQVPPVPDFKNPSAPIPLANQGPLQVPAGMSSQQAIQAAQSPAPLPHPPAGTPVPLPSQMPQQALPQAPMTPPPAGVQVPAAQPDVPQPQQPLTGQAALPTPTTDLQLELSKSFALAIQADNVAAQKLGGQLRDEYGVDNTVWTDEQLKTAITRVQAIATF